MKRYTVKWIHRSNRPSSYREVIEDYPYNINNIRDLYEGHRLALNFDYELNLVII